MNWRWEPYKNSARRDGFQMSRWQKFVCDAQGNTISGPANEDYFYAKFNRKLTLITYNDEEYRNVIQREEKDQGGWTKEETDHLFKVIWRASALNPPEGQEGSACSMLRLAITSAARHLLQLCELYDLRFPVIADRFVSPVNGGSRTVEDLKARYYGVARRLLIAREGCAEMAANEYLVKKPYDLAYEQDRKR